MQASMEAIEGRKHVWDVAGCWAAENVIQNTGRMEMHHEITTFPSMNKF